MHEITCFDGEYDFLSNFFPAEVKLDGERYPTVEHAFQAAKTLDPEQRHEIRLTRNPGRAKKLGRQASLREDWERIKEGIMFDLLIQKFRMRELRQRLAATGEAKLIEGNTWGDKVWGCVLVNDRWVGENKLGRMLMEVRNSLQVQDPGPI